MLNDASFMVSIAIFTSAAEAQWMRDNRPNVLIPDSLIERLDKAVDPRQEGLAICAEQLAALARIPGVSGANIMATTDMSLIPEAISAANLDEFR